VHVGTYTGKGSEGVYAYRFDPVNGESSALVLAGSTVDVFTYHPTKGTLRRKQTISTLPKNFAGKNTAAEIAVDEKDTFLYVSNRGTAASWCSASILRTEV
jgi:6-phosphogluconolactonase (cycloisomerase 2 family)